MTIWAAASLGLLAALTVPVLLALRGGTADRLVAVQLASALGTALLFLLTFVVGDPAFVDLALGLAILTLPGTLAMAFFLERWL